MAEIELVAIGAMEISTWPNVGNSRDIPPGLDSSIDENGNGHSFFSNLERKMFGRS